MIDDGFNLLVHGRRLDEDSESLGLPPLFVFPVFEIRFQLASMEDEVNLQVMRHVNPVRNLASLGSNLQWPLIFANQNLIHTSQRLELPWVEFHHNSIPNLIVDLSLLLISKIFHFFELTYQNMNMQVELVPREISSCDKYLDSLNRHRQAKIVAYWAATR